MNSKLISCLAVTLLAVFPIGCSSEDPAPASPPDMSEYIVSPSETGAGPSYPDLAEDWYMWALSIPFATNPIQEGDCTQQQAGDVFFLAGNAGGASERSCSIPSGKKIFFPIVNLVARKCPEMVDANYTCEMATSTQYITDMAYDTLANTTVKMSLEIDGQAITTLEEGLANTAAFIDPTKDVADDAFGSQCGGPIRDNTCAVAVGTPRDAVASGYWVLMNPLPAGQHDLHFTADVNNGAFTLDVAYKLTIAP